MDASCATAMEAGQAPKAHICVVSAIDVDAAPSPTRSRVAGWAAVATGVLCVVGLAVACGVHDLGAAEPASAHPMTYAYVAPLPNTPGALGTPYLTEQGMPTAPGAPSSDRNLLNPRAPPPTMVNPNDKNLPAKQVWVTFASTKDLKQGEIISGFEYGQEIAIVNTQKGSLYAVSNKLPPTGQPATFSKIEGDGIIDPISGTKFNLKTGKVDGTWCPSLLGKLVLGRLVGPQDVAVFPVRKQGDKVQVQINVNAKKQFEANYWRGILDSQGKVDGGYY